MKQDIRHKGKSGIYCIRNLKNGKVYIGKASCIYRRIKEHVTRLNRRNRDENIYLTNSWHKYGRENFEYFVVEFEKIENLAEREMFWIKSYNALDREKGYNLREDSTTGLIISEETRQKLRDAQIKRFKDPEQRRKCSHDFWKKNPEKLKENSKVIALSNVRYRIEQYDKISKKLIKTWSSIIELMEAHPEYKKHNIYAVCSGEKPSMYGFIWRKIKV